MSICAFQKEILSPKRQIFKRKNTYINPFNKKPNKSNQIVFKKTTSELFARIVTFSLCSMCIVFHVVKMSVAGKL